MMPTSRGLLFAVALLMCTPLAYSAPTVRIAIVLDGPVKREVLRVEQLKKEIRDLIAGDFDIIFESS